MAAISRQVCGSLYARDGQGALLLDDARPAVVVRFAFITIGEERAFFPHFLLDDWGNEITGLSLFRWAHENGVRFPRAELFGEDKRGQAAQYFLRELEYNEPLLCYAYPHPAGAGLPVRRFFLPDSEVEAPVRIDPPPGQLYVLRRAQASWWRVAPETVERHGYRPIMAGSNPAI